MISKIINYFYSIRQNIIKAIFELFNILFVKIYLGITLLINLLIWSLAIIINVNIGQSQLVLHYNVDFGVNLYGDVNKIFLIPLMGIIILIFNLLISYRMLLKEKFAAHILLASALCVNILLLISIGSLYLINFR